MKEEKRRKASLGNTKKKQQLVVHARIQGHKVKIDTTKRKHEAYKQKKKRERREGDGGNKQQSTNTDQLWTKDKTT